MAKADEAHKCTVPGCGRSFSSAQGLSLHKARMHKEIVKASSNGATRTPAEPKPRRRRRKVKARKATAVAVAAKTPEFNPNMLLRGVFPNGLPSESKTINETVDWLKEGERLFKAGSKS